MTSFTIWYNLYSVSFEITLSPFSSPLYQTIHIET